MSPKHVYLDLELVFTSIRHPYAINQVQVDFRENSTCGLKEVTIESTLESVDAIATSPHTCISIQG